MKRRFVAINHNRKRILFIILLIIVLLIIFILSLSSLFIGVKNIFKSEEEQVNIFNYGVSNVKILELDLLNPKDILSVSLNIKKDNERKLEITPKENNEPLVYIYNTHDDEKYGNTGVIYASKSLKRELLNYGIPSYVEEKSVSEYLLSNNMKKGNAFIISRNYIDDVWREHETLKYFIDIHVSQASSEVTSTTIGNYNYAKVLFVVSMDNKFYETTLEFANTINSMLDNRLSRGIMKKSDENNYYNQDMDAKCLFIELGGIDSNLNEIDNTLKVLAEILYQYMSEGYDGN